MTDRRSRSLAAIAGAFVDRIPTPMSTSPRATRVAPCQPLAASAAASAQSSRVDPSAVWATASTIAAATTSGRWLMAATAAS
jgi:hypothetical protein